MMWSFFKFLLKAQLMHCMPSCAPTCCHDGDNSVNTPINSCYCMTYNNSDLALHRSLKHIFLSPSSIILLSLFGSLVCSLLLFKNLFVPDPSQRLAEPELVHKDLVLTYQAGVCKKTCSIVLLLAATGALLEGLAVILELCPAGPVGAATCHSSFTWAWLLHRSCRWMLLR